MTNYGLKVNTKYNLKDYEEKVMTTAGDIVLFESGIYKIYCDGDIFIKHNITNRLIHIKCISTRDDIKINIEASGMVGGAEGATHEENVPRICSDIYHEVSAQNKNIEVNIKTKCVVGDNAKIIYRSNIMSCNGSGTGSQKAEFLKINDGSEVDAEPSLSILGDNFKCSHSFSVTKINEEKENYLALHGYEKEDIEKEIVESFLNS